MLRFKVNCKTWTILNKYQHFVNSLSLLLTCCSRVCKNLTVSLEQRGVDLLVLEGMGRALHTNLTARFTCECLKVAVVKNRWLANRLGGEMFSVICQYEA